MRLLVQLSVLRGRGNINCHANMNISDINNGTNYFKYRIKLIFMAILVTVTSFLSRFPTITALLSPISTLCLQSLLYRRLFFFIKSFPFFFSFFHCASPCSGIVCSSQSTSFLHTLAISLCYSLCLTPSLSYSLSLSLPLFSLSLSHPHLLLHSLSCFLSLPLQLHPSVTHTVSHSVACLANEYSCR